MLRASSELTTADTQQLSRSSHWSSVYDCRERNTTRQRQSHSPHMRRSSSLICLCYIVSIYVLTKVYANTFVANLVSRAFFDPSHRDRGRSTDDTEDTETGVDHGHTTTIALSTYVSNVQVWAPAGPAEGSRPVTRTATAVSVADELDRKELMLLEDERVSRSCLHVFTKCACATCTTAE